MHAANLLPTLCGAAQSAASPADKCALLRGPHASGWKLARGVGALSFAPGRPPGPSEPAREGEPRPRVRAAVARLTRKNPGAKHLGAWTGANPWAGLGQGETPASLMPLTVARLPSHSQNRSHKGGREERLEKERMEEEREEGSAGRGLQEREPGSLEMPQPSARLPALDAAPARPREPAESAGLSKRHPWSPARSGTPRGPPLRGSRPAGRPGLRSPCRRLPALRCSAGPRLLHAPPPAPRRRASLHRAPPPPRAPTEELRPRRAAFKYLARPRRERRPPPALGPGKLGRVGGLPRGPRGSTSFPARPEVAPCGRRAVGRRVPSTRGYSSSQRLKNLRTLRKWVPPPPLSFRDQLPRGRWSLCSTYNLKRS